MDTVAQFLSNIQNAGSAKHEKVDLPSSKIRVGIAQILLEQGFIRSFKTANDSKQGIMRVYLKYNEQGNHSVSKVRRVSKPGRRVYVSADEIPSVRSGLGFCVLSTSKGIMTGKNAFEANLGGELLCTIW